MNRRGGGYQLEHARVIARALAGAGVRDVVVSPGSRSTPIVLALLELVQDGLRIHDVIDERSAAFFALGQARATGRPSACVATSGTAGAHYFPAAIEASQSFLPLILITADRPLELQSCGALQTIDQLSLFGRHARAFFELGAPSREGGALALRALGRTVAQAVATSLHPLPGAVHLNVRARKPLEPLDEELEVDDVSFAAFHAPRAMPSPEAIEMIAAACRRAERGVIVAGANAGASAAVLGLARATRFPIVAEATSCVFGAEVLESFEPVLRSASFRRAHVPDLILAFGMAPTGSGLDAWLRESKSAVKIAIAPHGWHDPDSSAAHVVSADIAETCSAVAGRLGGGGGNVDLWSRSLSRANAVARAVIAREVSFGEGMVTKRALAAAPRGSIFIAGNGLPIRHLDMFGAGSTAGLTVLSQRGASGIDGLVSGAAGAAIATGVPVTLLAGDVAMLHDLGGLAAAAKVRTPLAIVVINNDGGRIFEQLPLARVPDLPAGALDHWLTPHGLSFRGAAEMFGLAYARVEDDASLAVALAGAQSRSGTTIIEARVAPHDAREAYERIDAAMKDRLDAARSSEQ